MSGARKIIVTAAAAAAVAAAAVIPTAAVAAARETAAVPRGLIPVAASWTTASSGVVLAYPSLATSAKPYLLKTGNGGKTWQPLPAPPLRLPAAGTGEQPDVIWADGIIAATDGLHVTATADSGKHWTSERLAGVSGRYFLHQLAVANGRVLALASTQKTAALYAGTAKSGLLRTVKGVSFPGSGAYGELATAGGAVQVDVTNGISQKYWYSRNGTSFTQAQVPCPAAQTLLGGVDSGKVVVVCSAGESAVGPGSTTAQFAIAPRLGGKFTASGQQVVLPNITFFAAASATSGTLATEAGLFVTTNGGKAWTLPVTLPNGAFWDDLGFASATTGFAVGYTFNRSGHQVNTLYRTTNSGRTWSKISLP